MQRMQLLKVGTLFVRAPQEFPVILVNLSSRVFLVCLLSGLYSFSCCEIKGKKVSPHVLQRDAWRQNCTVS